MGNFTPNDNEATERLIRANFNQNVEDASLVWVCVRDDITLKIDGYMTSKEIQGVAQTLKACEDALIITDS